MSEILHWKFLSVCAGESQCGNPIGSEQVIRIRYAKICENGYIMTHPNIENSWGQYETSFLGLRQVISFICSAVQSNRFISYSL